MIPEPSSNATCPTISRREIVNGILYILRTGASWRQMPHDLPNGKTVHYYFRLWSKQGIWKQAVDALRSQARRELGREEEPSAAIIDSQSIKTGPVRGSERGFDQGKKIWGRKRVLLVDTQGFLLAVLVLAANVGEREAAVLLLQDLIGCFPRIRHLFADQGYTGPLLDWIKAHLGWETEILIRSKNKPPVNWEWEAVLIDGQVVPRPRRQGRGFELQPQRWKIERTFGWLIRFRRLARDYESLTESSEAFIQIAAIRLLLKRLTPF